MARYDGDPQLAATLFTESALICQEIGDDGRVAESIEGLAGALADLGEMAEAARLFGAANGLRARTESPLLAVHQVSYDRDLDAVRAALGSDRLDLFFSEGEAIPANEISALLARWRAHVVVGESSEPAAATR